jgi:hypothetical protein
MKSVESTASISKRHEFPLGKLTQKTAPMDAGDQPMRFFTTCLFYNTIGKMTRWEGGFTKVLQTDVFGLPMKRLNLAEGV